MKTLLLKFQTYYYEFLGFSDFRRDLVKVYGGDILSTFIGALTALLIIRGLAVNEYASYTAFYSITTLTPLLIGCGINFALVRFSAEYISKTGKKPLELYFINFILQFVLYLIVVIFVLAFSDRVTNILFGQKAFDDALRYGLIAGAGTLITQAGRGVYNAEEKFGNYIRALWLRQLLIFLIILTFFLLNRLTFQHTARIIMFAELTVAGIIFYHISREARAYRSILELKKVSGAIKEFISSTKWLIAYFSIVTAFQKFDVFMLSHFSTEVELANYGVAFRYYSLAMIVLVSLNAVMLPKFSKPDMKDLDRQREFTSKWLKVTVWLFIPFFIFYMFGKPLFLLISGAQYDKAFYMFIVLLFGFWLNMMFSPMVHVVMARKAYKFLFFLGLTAFLWSLAGNYGFVPRWGGIGAACVTVIAYNLIHVTAFFRVIFSER